ncbi:MAG TPA: hypothetical protein VN817_06975 [Solirubrobacteraceae bacterium]|nr:hypothetical protein [Solirubrobacteraceae bacterium]
MPQITSNRLRAAATSALLVLLAGLLLAACGGGSSSKSSSSTSTSAKAAGGAGRQFGARGAALRTCLQKNGVTLPKLKAGRRRTPGAGGPFGAGGAGAAAKLPNGVTRAQLEAALKKCGGTRFRGGKGFAAGGAQRFAKFAACMRKNGVKLPQPNTSGKGPIFNTKGIDTTSASFKAADAKCAAELRPSASAQPGGQGAPGAGAPGAPGGAAPGEAPPGAPPSE